MFKPSIEISDCALCFKNVNTEIEVKRQYKKKTNIVFEEGLGHYDLHLACTLKGNKEAFLQIPMMELLDLDSS